MRLEFNIPNTLSPGLLDFGVSAQGNGAEDIVKITLEASGRATEEAAGGDLRNTTDRGNAVTIRFKAVNGHGSVKATAYDSSGNSTSDSKDFRVE